MTQRALAVQERWRTGGFIQLSRYYELTKPGIIYGNLLTAIAGFLLAAKWRIDLTLFLGTLFGTSCIIGGACTFNNYLDREIDQRMSRTQSRPSARGEISPHAMLLYGSVLTAVGFASLLLWVNWTVVLIGVVGFIDYVALYGLAKRRSPLGTLVGSVSGATPIMAGYCAVTGRFDLTALLLFLLLACWQLPHFYAIALFRRTDYQSAGLPVLTIVKSAETVKRRMMAYILLLAAVCGALTVTGAAGYSFLAMSLLLVLGWLSLGWRWRRLEGAVWGKRMFLSSLAVILGLSLALSVATVLA